MKPLLQLACILSLVLLVNCAGRKLPTPRPIINAQTGVSAMDTDLTAIGAGITAAVPHADEIGKAHLADATAAQHDAHSRVQPINDQLMKLAAENARIESDNAALKADANGWERKALGVCIVLGLIILAAGIATMPYTGVAGKFIVVGGMVLAVGSAALSLAVAAIALILPWLLAGFAVLILAALIATLKKNDWNLGAALSAIEQHKNTISTLASNIATAHAAVAEVVGDTRMYNEPNVAYTKPTQDIVQQVAGISAAAPLPVPSIQPGTTITVKPSAT